MKSFACMFTSVSDSFCLAGTGERGTVGEFPNRMQINTLFERL